LMQRYMTDPRSCPHCRQPLKLKIVENQKALCSVYILYPCGCSGTTRTTPVETTVTLSLPGTMKEFKRVKKSYDRSEKDKGAPC
jgi:hypothetical protein